jgi:hypothetical protein
MFPLINLKVMIIYFLNSKTNYFSYKHSSAVRTECIVKHLKLMLYAKLKVLHKLHTKGEFLIFM